MTNDDITAAQEALRELSGGQEFAAALVLPMARILVRERRKGIERAIAPFENQLSLLAEESTKTRNLWKLGRINAKYRMLQRLINAARNFDHREERREKKLDKL